MDLIPGDALDVLPWVPSGSVDAIITDPPYGTMEGANLDTWDAETTAWDVRIPTAPLLAECNRILRPNGALILFAAEPYTSHLITHAHANAPFSYRMVWKKDTYGNALIARIAPVFFTEDICCFFKKCPKHDTAGFHPLRPYAAQVAEYIGKGKKEVFADMGHQRACHFFRAGSTQFSLCTEETYSELVRLYRLDTMPGFIDYDFLKPVDDEYRGGLIEEHARKNPRVFNLLAGKGYKSNVLEYAKDRTGLHPTQKPVALMQDLVETFTEPGAQVLDFAMGSGSTGEACRLSGRRFIGIEKTPRHFETARARLIT